MFTAVAIVSPPSFGIGLLIPETEPCFSVSILSMLFLVEG
jgi:hypothetical protein